MFIRVYNHQWAEDSNFLSVTGSNYIPTVHVRKNIPYINMKPLSVWAMLCKNLERCEPHSKSVISSQQLETRFICPRYLSPVIYVPMHVSLNLCSADTDDLLKVRIAGTLIGLLFYILPMPNSAARSSKTHLM